jgi:hypothetical protein
MTSLPISSCEPYLLRDRVPVASIGSAWEALHFCTAALRPYWSSHDSRTDHLSIHGFRKLLKQRVRNDLKEKSIKLLSWEGRF